MQTAHNLVNLSVTYALRNLVRRMACRLHRYAAVAASALFVSLLVACGGGGGGTGQSPAAITAQPTDQSVVAGTAAKFEVVANNATNYQWQSNTVGGTTFANLSGATAASYTTAVTTLPDSGTRYRVAVTGAGNSVTSSAVTLTVTAALVAPGITVHPAGQTITEGQNASFSVTATGTSLSYQWQRSTNNGTSFTVVAGGTSATLNLTALPLAGNADQYRVVVSNSAGSVTSNAATLTVNAAQAIPAFTTQPASLTVLVPNTATFNVVATGTPSPTLQWQLSINAGVSFADIVGATASSYTTPATVAGDSGNQYRVVATNASGATTSTAATLTVNLSVAPSFTTQPANVSIVEGQNAQMSVVVSGTPTPTLQWQLSTDSGVSWSNIVGATGSVYSMTAVALANNGRQFRAVATNGSGSVNSTAALLTVTALPAGKSWGASALIETGVGSAAQPQIAVDPSGNAVAVWVQVDNTNTYLNIWANHYTVATHTWGTAAPIETGVGFSSKPQIAIDANGNALAVWQQWDSTRTREDIWANRYFAGTGWGKAQLIETDNAGPAGSPQIAIDANGNATAVWMQSNGTSSEIRSNSYSAGSGTWGTAITIIEAVSLGASSSPQIAIDANGNAIAVWSRYDGTNTVLTNRYTVGIGWGTAQVIGGAGTGPQIAIDANGNALATWSQLYVSTNNVNIWANRYTAGTGWGTAARIEWGGGGAGNQQVAFDSTGNAIAVWQQFDGTHYRIWSNRYTVNVGWGGFPTIIQTDSTGGITADATVPRIAIDINGNALAVWAQIDSGAFANIWANRYTAGSGWGTTATNVQIQINTGLNAGAGQPQIAVDANGNALAVWHQSAGAFAADSIFYNRFQ